MKKTNICTQSCLFHGFLLWMSVSSPYQNAVYSLPVQNNENQTVLPKDVTTAGDPEIHLSTTAEYTENSTTINNTEVMTIGLSPLLESENSSLEEADAAAAARNITYPLAPLLKECQIVKRFGEWNFDYKYTKEELNRLICKCYGFCSTALPDVGKVRKLKEHFQNPLSDINIKRFLVTICLYSFLLLLGLIGNTTTIIGLVVWVKSKTPTLTFILSLTVTDLLLLLVCVPLRVAETFYLTINMGAIKCKLFYYVRDFTFVCSILTMSVISFERYYAICHPFKAQYKCTKKRSRLIIVIVWCMSAVLAIPTIFTMKSYRSVYDRLGQYICRQNFTNTTYLHLFFTYYLGILFLLPLMVMAYAYGCSCATLWKSANRSKVMQGIGTVSAVTEDNPNTSDKGHNYQGRMKVIKMMIVILVMFTLCWGPSLIFQVLMIEQVTNNRDLIRQILDGLVVVNSCINPYIFMSMSSQFKMAAANACSYCRCLYKPCCNLTYSDSSDKLKKSQDFPSEISIAQSRASISTTVAEYY